jgi:glc operon protein GlcG
MPLRRLAIALLFALAAPVAVGAQTVVRRHLSAEGAQRAIAAALAEARRQQLNVSVAVVDGSGYLVAFQRMDAAPVVSVEIATGKARTAALFRRSSKAAEDLATARPSFIAIEGFKGAIEGAVPVTIDGEVVGAIGISGATSAQDASIAVVGSAAVEGRR